MPDTEKRQRRYGRGGGKPDSIDVRFGDVLRQTRVSRGMSQTDLGRAIGITFQQVQKYERGANRVSISTFLRIADALQVSPVELIATLHAAPANQPTDGAERLALALARDFGRLRSAEARQAVSRLVRALGDAENGAATEAPVDASVAAISRAERAIPSAEERPWRSISPDQANLPLMGRSNIRTG
jgi:transcriptional regulator with XRE-family HTH domain